ncbi:MAG: hypothetical protein IK054_08195 [Lachnospiraceae bacterium]|nr:hypothetical protein [Lachnospiraceae bacterium]MBR4755144.1 hypothetical protein [Lachnospiraceae bacterium]MBR4807381.1 hypothetical protein [Lachnospiraceae bacterium]
MPTGMKPDPARTMASTAFGIAIASVICMFTPGLAMGLSPLGIIMALLSRDDTCKLSSRALASVIICIVAFVISIVLTVSSFIMLINMAGGLDNLYNYLMEQMQNYPGLLQ